jgi:hypothetical protein
MGGFPPTWIKYTSSYAGLLKGLWPNLTSVVDGWIPSRLDKVYAGVLHAPLAHSN